MTLIEFASLDINAQANTVWNGAYVSTRVVDDHYVELYDLDSFFVEVIYDPFTNRIIDIRPGIF